ncbi:MAG: FAD-binding protein [Calditrichaeota bacterium]|jgi:glycolate oxidase subunit GlcD|nr:FAD-binding protein [Calditrichota bacterium]MBT7618253.1 FAD-binding protein [Calditrichota bacterium]MBT7788771.1 FAD-binding protein [Calditrichota bacterium]
MRPFWQKDPFQQLKRDLGNKERVLTSPEDLALYSVDATNFKGVPAAVVLAESETDISDVVNFANLNNYTITPRGAGSGLSGGCVPVEGGIVLSFERMNRIENFDVKNRTVIVQPGVVTEKLQLEAAKHGLFYPPDPSSFKISTIGGNVAENAGGLRCFKYGVTGHYVLGIEYIDAHGKLSKTGQFKDNPSEPDLTPLLTGSEGTLGIFTRIKLRLIPAPETTKTILGYFKDSESGLSTVEQIIQTGITPSVMEFIDPIAIGAAASHISAHFPEKAAALLMFEVDGSIAEVESSSKELCDILLNNAVKVVSASDAEERNKLWDLRRAISPSLIRIATGKIHEDIAVPRGKLLRMSGLISDISSKSGLKIAIYGHAGDGNMHVVILFDSSDKLAVRTAKTAAEDVFKAAISIGGTISGEHGIGCAKRDYLKLQLSDPNLNLSRQIKRAFDPQNILNPGKVLPGSTLRK